MRNGPISESISTAPYRDVWESRRPGICITAGPAKAKPRQAKPRQAKPRRAPKRPSELPEELANRIGLDPILQWMHRNGRPLTAERYLNLQGVPEEQLGYDEQQTLDLLRQLRPRQAKPVRASKRP